MSTQEELLAEIERLKAQLEAERRQKTAQTQDGAVAQGERSQAVGREGVLTGGDVGGSVLGAGATQFIVNPPSPESADPADLRRAYLNHLLESVGRLSLTGIDPKAASDAKAHLSLSAVYTALLTLSGEAHERLERGLPAPEGEGDKGKYRRLSALDQLNRAPRLVLLGDPGSGKTTFVNFTALCLAGEALGQVNANLKLLTAPLPPEEDDRQEGEQKPHPQPWNHGALLPVRVILRDFAARGLPPAEEKATARHLWAFIAADLEDCALGAFERHLASELLKKGGLLLLDGLDEVPEAEQRRAQIKQAIEDFAAAFPKCRVLVTSRTYAYQKQDWRLQGFAEAVLAPFTGGQIRQFVERWYAHIAVIRNLNAQDAQGRAVLLKNAIFNSDRLRGLAERPLLLTLMASLHAWRGGSLPEKREELYADAVELLLDWWESQRVVRDGKGSVLMIQPSLAEWLKVDRQKVRELLNELAYHAHAAQPDLLGTADVAENDLVAGLLRLSQNPDLKPARLVEYLRDRAGLLIPRGVGVYTFPHRTFQEYLAACYLTDHDYPEKIAALACADFHRWREAALLAGAKAGRGTPSAIWSLVDALCFADVSPDCEEPRLWGAHLAGQALAESVNVETVSERNRPKLERVKNGLVQVLQTGKLPAIERARAGDTLAKLGDPRPAATAIEGMQFCLVPPGPFVMGDGKERHTNDCLNTPYWIARCPVTVAQWRVFVEATNYKFSYWQYNPQPNHPVVVVTWYEALEFCKWLNGKYRARLPEGYAFGLPSEAEWEKAARGGLQVLRQPVICSLGDRLSLSGAPELIANPAPQREYAWEGDFDPNKANTGETGIGSTSAIGCFPGGVSPYGVLDMNGNVWEWTRSVFGDYPYPEGEKRKQREDLASKSARVLRGGSFDLSARYARCAYRLRYLPVGRDGDSGFRVVVVSPYFSPL